MQLEDPFDKLTLMGDICIFETIKMTEQSVPGLHDFTIDYLNTINY